MMENIGTCAFCGQTAMITTVGEVTQTELDRMATDKCMCQEAQSERRKKERKEAIEKYVNKTFDEPLKQYVHDSFEFVDQNPQYKVTIGAEGKSITIYSDNNLFTHIKTKVTEEEEFKV